MAPGEDSAAAADRPPAGTGEGVDQASCGGGGSSAEALLASLRREAAGLWRAGGGESLLEAEGAATAEHERHREAFCTRVVAEALHGLLSEHFGAAEDDPAPAAEGATGGPSPPGSGGGEEPAGDPAAAGQPLPPAAAATAEEDRGLLEVRKKDVLEDRGWREVRKKDSPEDTDVRGQEALEHAQQLQRRLVEANFREGKRQTALASAGEALPGAGRCWPAPPVPGQIYSNLYRREPPLRLRQVADGFASHEECRDLCGYCIRGMHHMFRRGGQTSLAVGPQILERRIGQAGAELVRGLVERTRLRILKDFGLAGAEAAEPTELYESGALLTRLQAEWERDVWEISGEEDHVYWNPHVDKANVASYDYAALLYLNSQGTHFEGGDFAFVDAEEDCLVSPRRGRLLAFTAGPENLHQARKVKRGTRFVLAMWFTLSAEHRSKDEREGG